MKQNLVITGMGAITPIGLGVDEYWRNLVAGACGVGAITRFDPAGMPCRIAAEVKDFESRAGLPRQIAHKTARFMQYTYAAAREALEQSGLEADRDGDRTGVCMGTAMAGVEEITATQASYLKSSTGKVSPHFVPMVLGNMPAAHLSIAFGLHGPGLTLNTACSAGGDSVMTAAMLLLSGEADAMLALGGESIICPSVVSSLSQARALSRRNDEPERASRPFDRDRDGFVIGEGGGALVLETERHALERGADILATLAGWGNTLDGWHITAPNPEGVGAAECMRRALARAGLAPCQIDYINAHGTSTQLGDRAEIAAIERVFGACGKIPPVSSTKGATGHLMGAGGLTEIIACIQAIRTGILPPTLNLEHPDAPERMDFVPLAARRANVRSAMSNSLGFGGQNSSIIVSRYQTAASLNQGVS